MSYTPAADRYEKATFRRCGRSGLRLPPISLGLWHNFGGVDAFENGRAIVRRAFDRGVTHLDLANNYGPPPGSAEEAMGRILDLDLRPYRDELVISTQGRLPDVARPLRRVGLAEVPALEPRPEPAADAPRVRGHLLLPPPRPRDAARRDDDGARPGRAAGQGPVRRDLELPGGSDRGGRVHPAGLGTPCLIHQPRYSMFDRWIEDGLTDVLEREGIGCIAFSPLAQGLLTDKYLDGIPKGSRASTPHGFLRPEHVTPEKVERARKLNEIAEARGQSLAQMALVWVLRRPVVTSALIGASSVRQLDENLDALAAPALSAEELARIEAVLA